MEEDICYQFGKLFDVFDDGWQTQHSHHKHGNDVQRVQLFNLAPSEGRPGLGQNRPVPIVSDHQEAGQHQEGGDALRAKATKVAKLQMTQEYAEKGNAPQALKLRIIGGVAADFVHTFIPPDIVDAGSAGGEKIIGPATEPLSGLPRISRKP